MPKIRPCARLRRPITHAAIVADYIANHRGVLRTELQWFSQPQPWPGVVRRAAQAQGPNNKRLSHQWRLLRTVIPAASTQLHAARRVLAGARTFADLLTAVETWIGSIRGVGPLYVYDTALRLGYPQRQPDRVYLHAGARKGARRLFPGVVGPSIPVGQFPPAFRVLEPHEIENLLCLYEECLRP